MAQTLDRTENGYTQKILGILVTIESKNNTNGGVTMEYGQEI